MTAAPALRVWGLTGGVASGKSSAARFFSEEGVPVVDADAIARELSVRGGAAFEKIQKAFGTADRAELRKIVFGDPKARERLEAILHPLIQAESRKRIQERSAKTGSLIVLYEAALLVETGRYKDFSGLIVIDAPLKERESRLVGRDAILPDLARSMIGAQASDEERREAATAVIENSGTLEELRGKIQDFVRAQGWPLILA